MEESAVDRILACVAKCKTYSEIFNWFFLLTQLKSKSVRCFRNILIYPLLRLVWLEAEIAIFKMKL